MDENRNTGPIIIILLTIAIAAGGWMWKTGRIDLGSLTRGGEPVRSTLVESVDGEVVEGFPTDLILASDARVQNSFVQRIDSTGQTITSVAYFTEATMPDIFAGYLGYFADNNYDVFLSTAKQTNAHLAARGRHTVGVNMELIDSTYLKVQVSITKNPQ